VGRANGVPRPAEPARQSFPEWRATGEQRVPGAGAVVCRARLRHVLPRRLRRPRHDARAIHRALHARFRPAPRQGLGAL